MKRLSGILLLGLMASGAWAADDGSQLQSPFRINYLGYFQHGPKVALFLSAEGGELPWSLKDAAGKAMPVTVVTLQSASGAGRAGLEALAGAANGTFPRPLPGNTADGAAKESSDPPLSLEDQKANEAAPHHHTRNPEGKLYAQVQWCPCQDRCRSQKGHSKLYDTVRKLIDNHHPRRLGA